MMYEQNLKNYEFMKKKETVWDKKNRTNFRMIIYLRLWAKLILIRSNVMLYLMYFDAVKNSFLPMLNNDVNSAQCACNSKQAYIRDFEIFTFRQYFLWKNYQNYDVYPLDKVRFIGRKALASTVSWGWIRYWFSGQFSPIPTPLYFKNCFEVCLIDRKTGKKNINT